MELVELKEKYEALLPSKRRKMENLNPARVILFMARIFLIEIYLKASALQQPSMSDVDTPVNRIESFTM